MGSGDDMASGDLILFERPADGVARLVVNRPEARNAQSVDLLYRLDDAFTRALLDDAVRVIIVAAAGVHFSTGHDLRQLMTTEPKEKFEGRGGSAGYAQPGGHGYLAREREVYFDLTRRWRNLGKPTIAEVQGQCIAGGLMLAWACDMIVAADNAVFRDPVVAMGVSGVEWFAHPWELGSRKAKELLMTGASWSAEEARGFGMVNHVVPLAELPAFTLDLARRIAAQPVFAVKMVKEAVNGAIDQQGQPAALNLAFQMHQLCHYHNRERFGFEGDPGGMPNLTKRD